MVFIVFIKFNYRKQVQVTKNCITLSGSLDPDRVDQSENISYLCNPFNPIIMRYKGRRQSTNVEDRRGVSSGKKVLGGGIGIIVIAIIVWILGGDPMQVLQLSDMGDQSTGQVQTGTVSEDDTMAVFVSVVLADTEEVWEEIFRKSGQTYKKPNLVLYSSSVQSACGYSSAATGPFYCPGDQKVYIDLAFFDDLKRRFGAPGDFAIAYVVAHEIGHHVQNLLGILPEVQAMRGKLSQTEYNQMMVKVELQADFLAGLWAHHAQRRWNILEAGDIEEALGAASAVGDDRLQKKSQGYVVPDSFTHGTSKQRQNWFYKGFQTGDLAEGDTFNARVL